MSTSGGVSIGVDIGGTFTDVVVRRSGAPTRLMAGPGKLCAALGITGADSGADLLGNGFRIFRAPGKRPRLAVSARIGVDYAGDAKDWPLRFFDAGSAAVSRA